jgi:hypothetical protein
MPQTAFTFLGLLTCVASLAVAQPLPLVDRPPLPGDTAVRPATNSQQEHSAAKGGNQYLVAWSDSRGRSSGSQTIQGDGDVFGIRLDANGDAIDAVPFLIAGGMGLQRYPTVAWNGENWLVVYQSQDPVGEYFETQIRAVRVSPSGAVLDAAPILLPPTQFTPSTIGLTVAGQNGQWLISRCIYHDDGYGTFLGGQRLSSAGQLLDSTPIVLNDWVYGATKTIVANGEYLVVGTDWSTSGPKARRIGLNGQPLGPSFGVPSMNIAGNGTEYFVVWIANYVNLVGSRMTSNGTLLVPAGTTIVENFSPYNQSTLTHDGTNWWLEWGASDILRTVRINANGHVLDPNGGVLLPITIGGNVNNAYDPALLPQTGGGVHVFWYDLRVALGYDANVFVLPVNAANVPAAERCVSTGTTSQRNPDLAPGHGDTLAVAYVSEAANDDRVLVHLLDAAANPIGAEPIEVYRGPTVGSVGIAFNGAMYMIVFDVGASGLTATQIKARRMNADGSFVDAQAFNVMPGFNAAVGSLGDDFLVAGTRSSGSPQFISLYGNRIDGPTAQLLDGAAGVFLGGNYVSCTPRVRSDGTHWWVAAHSMWSHDSSQGDAVLAKVPPIGAPVLAFNPTPFSGGSGDLDIAFSGSNYLLVWRMNSLANANNYIAGRIMDTDGTFPPGYFIIAEATGRQLRPTVAWDGAEFIVAWDDQRNQEAFFDARTDVYATRVSEDGTVLDQAGFAIHASTNGAASPALFSRGNGVTYVGSTRFLIQSPYDSYRVGLSLLGETMMHGDMDGDGDVDAFDLTTFTGCMRGPAGILSPLCFRADMDGDADADLQDYFLFTRYASN